MLKRVFILLAVVVAGIVAFLGLQHLRGWLESQGDGMAKYRQESGEFMAFLIQEMQRYRATVVLPSSVPSMNAEWRYAEDTNGFQIALPRARRDELIQALTRTFGKPTLHDNYPELEYQEGRLGVSILGDTENEPMHIICLRKGVLP